MSCLAALVLEEAARSVLKNGRGGGFIVDVPYSMKGGPFMFASLLVSMDTNQVCTLLVPFIL